MTEAQILKDFSALPQSLQFEVGNFIAFLKQKSQTDTTRKKRPLGLAKGKIVIKKNFKDSVPGFE